MMIISRQTSAPSAIADIHTATVLSFVFVFFMEFNPLVRRRTGAGWRLGFAAGETLMRRERVKRIDVGIAGDSEAVLMSKGKSLSC